MANTQTRSTKAAHTENMNAATQQVNNPKNGKAAPAPKNTPAPVKVEDLEARLKQGSDALSKAKKQNTKSAITLSEAKTYVENQSYVVAVAHANLGTASTEELALIASRKAADNAHNGLEKFFSMAFKDSDEVAKAWEDLSEEFGSVSSAIAETNRLWNKGFKTLYESIGIANKKQLTASLLKGLCPFMQIASADGLKAAIPVRRAVRKNGKVVKKHGEKVYKYTLRQVRNWTAKNLFKVLQANHRMVSNSIFTEDELATRKEVLMAEVSALSALKQAKEAISEAKKNPDAVNCEAADRAAKQMGKLKEAAKAAGSKAKENASTVGSKSLENAKKKAA